LVIPDARVPTPNRGAGDDVHARPSRSG